MSEEDIVNVYKMGLASINEIEKFVNKNGNFCHFRKCPSLIYTNNLFKINPIKDEHNFRLKHGFVTKLYNENNNPFPFKLSKVYITKMAEQS